MNRTKAQIVIFVEGSNHIEILSEALVSVDGDPENVMRLLKDEKGDVLIADTGTLNSVRTAFPGLPVICICGSADLNRGVSGQEILSTGPYRISHIEECVDRLLQRSALAPKRKSADFILVVDDGIFRTLPVRSLRLSGYAARKDRDGQDAIEIIEKGDVFAVIADIHMPGIDAITPMKNVKRRTPEIPVILITGYHISNQWPAGSDVSLDLTALNKMTKILNRKKRRRRLVVELTPLRCYTGEVKILEMNE